MGRCNDQKIYPADIIMYIMAKSAHDAWARFMCGTCAHMHIQVTAVYCHSLHKFLELPIVYYDFDIKAPVYILFLYDEVEKILKGSLDSIPMFSLITSSKLYCQ